ncbi:MAG: invasion associated locus B family protein [Pseudomonadota bacterium]
MTMKNRVSAAEIKRRFKAGAAACALATSLIIVGGTSALAQTPSKINQFKAWGAYSYNDNSSKVCYILSIPTEKKPSDRDHGDVFFLVSQKPGQNVAYEPQVEVGYPFKENSEVRVNIDGKNYVMFTKGKNAWMKNAAEEPALVSSMRAGSNMTVSGMSRRGTETSYNYSLSGVTAALKEIAKCK